MQGPSTTGRDTFHVLNGLRGVAAIAVATMHLSYYLTFLDPANVASAVEFFFVLSGFVIAYAYGEQLNDGPGVGRFTLARLVRLYPVYFLGLVAGALTVWVYQRPADPGGFVSHIAFNLFMLPSPFALDPTSGIVFVAALCAGSWLLDRIFDCPVRRRLSKALVGRPTHAGDPKA